jgi:hypothetical protein
VLNASFPGNCIADVDQRAGEYSRKCTTSPSWSHRRLETRKRFFHTLAGRDFAADE